jgi:hypothetical protein
MDQYVYRRLHTKKNRVVPPLKTTCMRICISKNGGEGTGVDRVFDTLRFFEEIGRLKWGSGLDIELDGKEFNYFDLKKQIESDSALTDECLDLLDSGKAFLLYKARLGSDIGKADPEDEESED